MKKRFLELDLLRGLAICGMIVYHFYFVLFFFGIYVVDFENLVIVVLAQIVRFIFLSLVGVGMLISYERILARGSRLEAIFRQWKRAFGVLLAALVVSVVTYLVIPENFVRFGILHMIALSMIFWSFFVEWKWLVLAISMLCFWLGGWFPSMVVGSVNFSYFLKDMGLGIQTVDYFPFLPWTGLVGMGIFLGHLFYPKGNQRFAWKIEESGFFIRFLSYVGRHSLLIYLLHVPIIFGILWILGLLKF